MIVELTGRSGLAPQDIAQILGKLGEVIEIGYSSYAVVSDRKIVLVVYCQRIEDGLTNIKIYLEEADILKKLVELYDELEVEIDEVTVH
ncbi:MAG: hypothetical protein DRJ63_06480 [Thermoprotei archaeon]|nr:MAG: hypothetical protein DRJ63_06480 [Thermoprotei archaeon]